MNRPDLGRILRAVGSVLAAGLLLASAGARAQLEETSVALPLVSLTFSTHYIAEDLGLLEKAGLRVKSSFIGGIGAANAVLAGSVDFSNSSGPTVVRANARGQKLLAIGITIDRPMLEVVLHKDIAAKLGITEAMPIAKKAAALKGLRLGIDRPNTIPNGYMRYFLTRGKLSPDRDVTLAPMEPPALIAALKSGAVAGFVMSQPWTLIPVQSGMAVRLVSSPLGDFPELVPFAYNVVITRADFCDSKPTVCRKLLSAYQQALNVIHERPQQALAVLRKRFANLDGAVVGEAFEQARKATPAKLAISEDGLKHAEELMVSTGMVKPEESMKSFGGIYTNRFQPQ
ncbi:MAG: ABC transporter substrate-binding protein [Burkholderiales bacterium]|nr:ABC transporter substrate-binding protein [Burkholderiales bacterium]